jgi:hypothetical protein
LLGFPLAEYATRPAADLSAYTPNWASLHVCQGAAPDLEKMVGGTNAVPQGISIADGHLPNVGLDQIIETSNLPMKSTSENLQRHLRAISRRRLPQSF